MFALTKPPLQFDTFTFMPGQIGRENLWIQINCGRPGRFVRVVWSEQTDFAHVNKNEVCMGSQVCVCTTRTYSENGRIGQVS